MVIIAILIIAGSLTSAYTLAKKQNSKNMSKYVCEVCGRTKWDVKDGICQECANKKEE